MDERNPTTLAPRSGVVAGVTATLAVVLALAPPAGAATPEALAADHAEAARALGEHTLHRFDGSTFSLASLRGQVVVVNFWASWCAPCRKELPRLDALNAELAKSGGRVVAVSIDTDANNARRFVTAHQITMPVAQDGPDGLAHTLDLLHVPCTVVLNRDGSIAYAVGGGDEAALDQVTRVARQLSGRAPVVASGHGSETP